jgi:hypothetical protein
VADIDNQPVKIKSKNFVMWWIRFKAYAKVQKFSQALATTQEADVPVSQEESVTRQVKLLTIMNKHYQIWQWCSLQQRLWSIFTRQEVQNGQMGFHATS